MMGGMGEETVYECNLVQEATEEQVAAAKAAKAAQEPEAAEEAAEEEPEAQDPAAAAKAAAAAAEAEEEEEDEDGAEPYPDISYGAPVPEKLADAKMEKKMKKVIKEGAKRGVEIEGAADMGGLQFFCTTMEEPGGDVDLLYESMKGMNEKSDPTEEERKGGSGRIGKMIISKDQADSKLALVAYVPPAKQPELPASEWMTQLLKTLGGGEIVYSDATTAKARSYETRTCIISFCLVYVFMHICVYIHICMYVYPAWCNL